jgi:hypothetical protein
MPKPDNYTETEAERRMNDALRRALNTPPIRKPEPKRKTAEKEQGASRDTRPPQRQD